MIKIRGGFVQSIDGAWHNLRMIKYLYVGGADEVGYRICMSYDIPDVKIMKSFGVWSLGDTRKTKEEAQTQLDVVFEVIEYERLNDI